MNAHKVAATFREDGTLVLRGLPFQAGDTVEIIILESLKEGHSPQPIQSSHPLQDTGLRYDDPSELAADRDYLDAVAATMTEWNSEADDLAYGHL